MPDRNIEQRFSVKMRFRASSDVVGIGGGHVTNTGGFGAGKVE